MSKIFTQIITFVIPICLAGQSSASSTDTLPTAKKNISNITLVNGTMLNGYIVSVSDSTITFLNKEDFQRGFSMNSQVIPAENIQEVNKRFRKKISTGGGILRGTVMGMILGFGFGLSQDCDHSDDPNNPNDADDKCDFIDKLFSTKSFTASFIFASILGTAGAIIGLISPKKSKAKFGINGRRENIRNNRNGLLFY